LNGIYTDDENFFNINPEAPVDKGFSPLKVHAAKREKRPLQT
jgi:hypothetical protein